jgi:hypothetical protein
MVDNDYTRRIKRLHNLYPEANLNQLRGHARKRERPLSQKPPLPLWKRVWSVLSPHEKLSREKSLDVLSDVRRNKKPLSRACREKGISIKTVLEHTNAFKKIGDRWTPKAYDRIPRTMLINENGRETSVTIADSRAASKIGRYHNAVKQYLETGDDTELMKFKGKQIKDINGGMHAFETDTEALDIIAEGIEEPEFYDIYGE